MNKMRFIVLIGIVFLFSNINLNAQVNGNGKVELNKLKCNLDQIPRESVSSVLDSVGNIFENYAVYGTLINKEGEPDARLLRKFRKLFETNTKVADDLREVSEDLLSYDQYMDYMDMFIETGLKYDITDAYIVSVALNEFDYEIKIRFNKHMYRGFDKNGIPKNYRKSKSPIVFDLTMTVKLSKVGFSNPRITRIFCNNQKRPNPPKEAFAGVGVSYGMPKISGTQSAFVVGKYENLNSMLRGGSNLTFGVDFMRNFVGGKKIYWNLGLEYNILNFTTTNKSESTISTKQNTSFGSAGEVPYIRYVNYKSTENNPTEETVKASHLTIPIGLYYRKDFGVMHTVFIGANIIPSFYLNVDYKFNGAIDRKMGILKGENKDEEVIILDKKYKDSQGNDLHCNGEDNVNNLLYAHKPKSFKLYAGISLKYIYKYAYNQSVGVHLSYRKSIKPILDNPENIFLIERNLPTQSYDTSTSFTQTLFKDLNASIILFGISWYYNFKSRRF